MTGSRPADLWTAANPQLERQNAAQNFQERAMRHTLSNGRRIRIQVAALQGLWEDPEGVITLDRRLEGRGLVEALLHEVLHAENPRMSERDVERTAHSQAKALWTVMRTVKRGDPKECK